jgi:hypothetical protein
LGFAGEALLAFSFSIDKEGLLEEIELFSLSLGVGGHISFKFNDLL